MSTEAYLSFRKRSLNQKLTMKYKTIRSLNNKIKPMKNNLHNKVSCIDSAHVITKYLIYN